MRALEYIHKTIIHSQRIKNLTKELSEYLPNGASILDVGCGDGLIASTLAKNHNPSKIEGVDILIRNNTHIPVVQFDGEHLPYKTQSWDYVIAIDVLHHTESQSEILREMLRVSRLGVIIKDHIYETTFDKKMLFFMDRLGNRRHGVPIPANYLSEEEWTNLFNCCGAEVETGSKRIKIYPWPLSSIFGRNLHCIYRLRTKVPQSLPKKGSRKNSRNPQI